MDADASLSNGGNVKPFQYWLITFDGTLLRKRRRQRGVSQEQLGYRSSVSLRTIQRVEKLPAARCHAMTLHRLASILSPDPAALIAELTAGLNGPAPPAARRTSGSQPPYDQLWLQRTRPSPADHASHTRYDAAMARELLTKTGSFPRTKSGMAMLLTEYRNALYDLATESVGNSN